MEYSLIQEKLGPLWRAYWELRDKDVAAAEKLQAAIKQALGVVNELIAENKRLTERNQETERLLVEAIRIQRSREKSQPGR